MKKILAIVLLFTAFAGNAQKITHNLSLGLSNNGQLSRAMSNFYFVNYYTPESEAYNRIALKGDLTYSIATAENLEFGIAMGYGKRADRQSGSNAKVDASQQYASVLPFVLKGWNLGPFQLSAGAGIPFYAIGNYVANAHTVDGYRAYMKIDGGMALGLNGLMRVKWNFSPRFSLSGQMNFGVLYMNYGEKYLFNNFTPDEFLMGSAKSNRKQVKTVIPAPELSMAIGFRI